MASSAVAVAAVTILLVRFFLCSFVMGDCHRCSNARGGFVPAGIYARAALDFVQDDNWEDLRLRARSRRGGTPFRPPRAGLGVNASTVVRRIGAGGDAPRDAVPRTHGRRGYAVPSREPRGDLGPPRGARRDRRGVTRRLDAGRGGRPWLRVTSTDTFCLTVRPGIVAGLSPQGAGRRIELLRLGIPISISLGCMPMSPCVPRRGLPDDMTGEVVAELRFGAFEGPAARGGLDRAFRAALCKLCRALARRAHRRWRYHGPRRQLSRRGRPSWPRGQGGG